MKTINAINRLLREYELLLERSVAKTEEEYESEKKNAGKYILQRFCRLREILPNIVQINYDEAVSSDETERIILNLRKRVENRFVAGLLPTGEVKKITISKTDFQIPYFTEWQSSARNANFVINYGKSTLPKAQKALNTLVSNMLLSLPVKAVHLNFVDLNFTGQASLFTKNLDKRLYRDLVVDAQQLNDLCKELQSRMVTILQECGNLADYHVEHAAIRYPYEIIVLLDYPGMYDYVSELLVPLFQNGHKGGIYFVVMNNKEAAISNGKTSLVSLKDHYYEIDLEKIPDKSTGLVRMTSLMDNQGISKAVFDYISQEASRKPKASAVKPDYENIYRTRYVNTDSEIEVPVGKSSSGEIVSFNMDTVSHVHGFILGQSGSGKSVFLHSIIASVMLKYKPEDVQFYLLDFKMGGVEFNRYRNAKHVKALLVDNSDTLITLEILRDLNDAMKERGRALRAAGVSSIAEYNRRNPNAHMPQIVLVADECHAMFSPGIGKDRKTFAEISEIVAKIAKEGRSQGVHLLLATQTLAETEISNEVLHNITDHYLLKCAAGDSERMVRDSSDKTSDLTTGQVYYHHVSSEAFFQSYYTPNQEFEKVMDLIVRKAADNAGNGQFYFNGAQVFSMSNDIISHLPAKRNPMVALGYSVNLNRQEVNIPLKSDDGENILFFGINDEGQVSRTVTNALISAVLTAKSLDKARTVKVMNLLDLENASYMDDLESLNDKKLIGLVKKNDCGKVLYELASGIQSEEIGPTLLVILGQERLRGLKLDLEIENISESKPEKSASDDNMFGNFDFGAPLPAESKFNTYRKALAYILDNGPRVGVNVLLQIDQPGKLLFEDYVSGKTVFTRFNHVVMFRSDEKAANILQLRDDIQLDNLPSDPERMRAFYYSVEKDVYQLFTPYAKSNVSIV